MLVAEYAFIGLQADAWAAIGIWVTIAVYLTLAWYARGQIKEAQALRIESSRPYMVAQMRARSILIYLVFKNIGRTSAHNVRIRFDGRLQGSKGDELAWQDSPAFTGAIASFPPGHEITFFFDSFLARMGGGLPMLISGTISYEDSVGRPYESEPFLIDLDVYEDSVVPEKDIPDLVSEVEKMRKEMENWSSRGLPVNSSDRDKQARRTEQVMRARRTRRALASGGVGAATEQWWRNSRAGLFLQRWRT